jgi:hypothetical protein
LWCFRRNCLAVVQVHGLIYFSLAVRCLVMGMMHGKGRAIIVACVTY